MASNVAPPKNTGGGGFVFEDDVSAWLLACMLVGEPIFGPALGEPVRLDFQTRVDKWFLDDVLVTTVAAGTNRHRFALSVKSNAQFTAAGAPADLVATAWQQWLHVNSSIFDSTADFMGIVTGTPAAAARNSVTGLLTNVRNADPSLFPSRLATEDWANEDIRGLFASFARPQTLATTHNVTDADTVRLLQRVYVQHHDFGESTSASLISALQLCQRALRSGVRADAESLWDRLRSLAAELRPVAGHITRKALVGRLKDSFVLADFPDYKADWHLLDQQSAGTASQVQNAIAGRIVLKREASAQSVGNALKKHACVVIVGASGVGKSAVTRGFFETRVSAGARALWFDAPSFERYPDFNAFEASLRLTYPLAELLSAERGGEPVLIVDGLDRLYSDKAFTIAARLLRLARQEPPAAQWRIVAPCQVQEWARALEGIQRAGFIGASWGPVELAPLSTEDLIPVRQGLPTLRKLFLQPRVSGLLGNLKVLDLVARRAVADDTVDTAGWVGESSVADWFWTAEVERGADRIPRGAFVRRLAQRQADLLLAAVPIDDFAVADLAPLDSLTADRVCVTAPGDRLAFGHDLFGDWARLRLLLQHRTDLSSFLSERSGSPLWHRAIRLLGVHLLEQEGGVVEWRKTIAAFGGDAPGAVHDLLLEAPVFAANAAEVLAAVFPDLIANDGMLIRRLLARFLAFATIPDTQKLALAKLAKVDDNFVRTKYRIPYWPYWLDMLRFLHGHATEVLASAPSELARVVEMWLDFVPEGGALRREVGELAVAIGRMAVTTRKDYRGRAGEDERQRFYKCALAASHEFPDEVARIALIACERPTNASDDAAAQSARKRRRRGIFPGPTTPVEPWPDGPIDRVDDAFRAAVLDSADILDLFRVRPAVAREVVLATLIEPPDENDWSRNDLRRSELDFVRRPKWHPALYVNGPFIGLLNVNFDDGLRLILRLVDFATSRWLSYAVQDAEEWRGQTVADPEPEPALERAISPRAPQDLVIAVGSERRSFVGGEHVYGWSAGLGNPPETVQAALMALEQYFYMKIDKGEDIDAVVSATLVQAASVAILGVLCDVGKRIPALFEGPLRLLLAAPEFYLWEITKNVYGRGHLMIYGLNPDENVIRLAQAFHYLPHRKTDLRRLAMLLLIRRPSMREYFASVVAAWRSPDVSSVPGRAVDMREQMIVMLDFDNYEERDDPEHGPIVVNVAAEREQAESVDERAAMNDHFLVTGLPMRCRKVLDEQAALSSEDLEILWQQWQRVRELASGDERATEASERFGDEFANATAAGAAALLSQSALWADVGTRRDAALQALHDIVRNPPPSGMFDSADSVSDWTWDCFAAEAFAMVWAREPANVDFRTEVANMVLAPHYQAVRLLFQRCAERRASLPEKDFSRLRRLALEWAYVRDRVDVLRHTPREALRLDDDAFRRIQENLTSWQQKHVGAFVSGTSEGMPADWTECDDRVRFPELDAFRAHWDRERAFDFYVVRSAHQWGPLPERALNEEERREWLQFWRSAMAVVLVRPRTFDDEKQRSNGNHYPDDNERWVLDGIALILPELRAEEDAAAFWEPIIDLAGEAHHWPEVFLRDFHGYGLSANPTPASYVTVVQQMVRRAFVEVEGKPRWRSYEQVWEGLIGIDAYAQRLWEERHAPLVAALADTFEFWCAHVRPDGRRLSCVAHWLSRPAAAPLRLQSLAWFASVLQSPAVGRFRDSDVDEAADALAGLLNVIWSNDQDRLRANGTVFGAFRSLLDWLVARQNDRGMELAGRIGGLG